MHYRSIALTTVFCLAAAVAAPAQLAPRAPAAPAPQAPPPPQPLKEEEALKKLAELEAINKTLDEQKFGHNAKIIKELRDAGVSADKSFGLWLDCKKDVEFDQQGKTSSEFSDWKRRQTKDPNHERDAELQMQVQWLAIVLMDANAKTDAARNEAVTAAVSFLDGLVERIKKAEGRLQGAAGENVFGSVFARHYKLETTVSRRDGGAYVPGDVDGIYERMLMPYYRSSKQAVNLMKAWARRIEQQKAIAASFPYREARDKFDTEKLPELLWGQARELFKLGQETSAAQTMMSLIKDNLTHRRASDWIAELTALLKKEEPAAPTDEKKKPEPAPAPEESGNTPPRPPGFRPNGGGGPPKRS